MPASGLLLLLLCGLSASCGDPVGGEGHPLATFVSWDPVQVYEEVAFDARFSRDDGLVESYSFNFGDGSPTLMSANPVVHHVFRAAGAYVVELEVYDEQGNIAYERRTLTVGAGPAPSCSPGSCAGLRSCEGGPEAPRCTFLPAECRAGDSNYECGEREVCSSGLCTR